jgi:hypothetical protein
MRASASSFFPHFLKGFTQTVGITEEVSYFRKYLRAKFFGKVKGE